MLRSDGFAHHSLTPVLILLPAFQPLSLVVLLSAQLWDVSKLKLNFTQI